MNLTSYSVLIILLFFLLYAQAVVKYPIIFVPGDGGSQIEAKLNKPSVVHYLCDKTTNDYFSLWLNMELLMPVVIDCFIDNMRLVYNNTSRKTSNSPGVYTRVPGFGNCSSVEWIDPSKASPGTYFKDIADMLRLLGYQGGFSLRGAPYDFRKGPNEQSEYFQNLTNLIEETYQINGNKKVILLVHSLGGLMSLAALHQQSQEWKDKYVRAMISLAGVWGGAVKAVKVYVIGDDLGVYVLRGKVLRAEQISSPSLAWLLPSPFVWESNEVLVETPDKNYTLANLKEFFEDINYSTGWDMYQDVFSFANNFEAPGVELHCLYGYGIPTVDKLSYKKGAFPLGTPALVMGDGDGTVNKRSLTACERWSKVQKQPIYQVPLAGIDHMTVLRSMETIKYIQNLLEKMQ